MKVPAGRVAGAGTTVSVTWNEAVAGATVDDKYTVVAEFGNL
jgi:hypothetical protein